jgi:hypothetical protein
MRDFFDDNFKEALDRQRSFHAEDADWEAMQGRLNRVPPRLIPEWVGKGAFGAITFLLLFSAGGWWYTSRQLAHLQKTINTLVAEQKPDGAATIAQAAQTPTGVPSSVSTGYKRNVAVVSAHTDAAPAARAVLPPIADKRLVTHKNMLDAARSPGQLYAPTAGNFSSIAEKSWITDTSSVDTKNADTLKEDSLKVLYTLTPLSGRVQGAKGSGVFLGATPPYTLSLPVRTHRLRTARWYAGLSAGGFVGVHHEAGGRMVGVHVLRSLGRHLYVQGELRSQSTARYIRAQEQAFYELPVEQPPAPDFGLSHIRWQQRGFIATLGLRWQFRPEQRWQPFLGAAFSGGYKIQNQAHYIFERTDGRRLLIERSFRQGNTQRVSGQAQGGLDYLWGKHLRAGAEILVQPGDSDRYRHTDDWQWGLRGYIFYGF